MLSPLIILFTLIFVLWAVSGISLWFLLPDWGARGTFGDTFGAVNSLFSGFAFAGVIYTILLQRKQENREIFQKYIIFSYLNFLEIQKFDIR